MDLPRPRIPRPDVRTGCVARCVHVLDGERSRAFIRVLFADGKTAAQSILKPDTLKSMLVPQFEPAGVKRGFGLGFFLSELDGHRRVGHGGAIYGFVTEVALLPDEKLGVVVIANKDIADWVTYRLADDALRCLLAARAGKPMPAIEKLSLVSRDTARKTRREVRRRPATRTDRGRR